jgi:asparagine synthase (glutamine-hydrolysing)
LKVDTRDGKKYGKWILRKTFEGKIPEKILWREKSPMQDGAGTNKLGDLFENMISDSKFDEKRKTIQKLHGIHQTVDEEINSCPYCHFNTENSKFCRMCGAFPI